MNIKCPVRVFTARARAVGFSLQCCGSSTTLYSPCSAEERYHGWVPIFHGRGLHSTGIAVVLSTPAKSTLLWF